MDDPRRVLLLDERSFGAAVTREFLATTNPFGSSTHGATKGRRTCGRITLRPATATEPKKEVSEEKLISAWYVIQQIEVMPSRAHTNTLHDRNECCWKHQRANGSFSSGSSGSFFSSNSHFARVISYHETSYGCMYLGLRSTRHPMTHLNTCVEEATTKADQINSFERPNA